MIQAKRSYWEKDLYENPFDLIVIGAGLTGQSLAYFYKKENPGHKVLILERGFFPIGASTRNAGFACFGSVTEHMADLEKEEEDRIIDRIRRRYEGLQLLKSTLGTSAMDYQEPGGYEIFTDKKVYQSAVNHIGLCNEWLEKATGQGKVYSETEYNGYPAIKIKHEGALHPGKMMRRLQELNALSGVEFRWHTPVKNIRADEGAVVLNEELHLNARKIAVATNSFTSSLTDEIDLKPGRGQVFVTKPLIDLKWKGTFHYDRGYYYFRNVGPDRLLLGGARSLDEEGETTTDFGINEMINQSLKAFADEVLKLPDGWEIEQQWSGIMGFTPSKSPVLKKISDKAVVVAGLSGMGVALGMQLGKEGAGILSDI